jgi:acyl-CoA synthetase (NDP forming)
VVTASGGQAELILDAATEAGVDLPPLDAEVRRAAEQVIGPLTGDGNPLDAWGNGDFAANFPHALHCLDIDPNYDAVAMCSDANDGNPMGRATRALDNARLLAEAAAKSAKPHYMVGTRVGLMERAQIDLLRQHGIPFLTGVRQSLLAIARLGCANKKRQPPLADDASEPSLASLLGKAAGRATIHEADAKQVLASHKLPVARELLARDWEGMRAAAAEIGWPVAVKIASDRIAHKSEHGLVTLDIKNEGELRSAYNRLLAAARTIVAADEIAGLLVQEMVRGGIEMFVGVSRDPDFGLVVAAGLGGIGIEVFKDYALRLLPLAAGDAAAMIEELKTYPLLCGARSQRPYDIDALVDVIERVGALAWAGRDYLGEIDLNPVMVFEACHGCRIVDALIVPRAAAAQKENAA